MKKEVAESDSSDSEDSDYLEDNLKPIKQEPVVPKICLLVRDCLYFRKVRKMVEAIRKS